MMSHPFSEEEIENFRKDTPGTGHVIHFNNAGAALPPQQVTQAQIDYIQREGEIGGYEVNAEKQEELNSLYTLAAEWLNCSGSNIAFTDSATTSWLRAFYSIPFRPGDRILTSEIEYASNYLAYLHLARQLEVEVIPVASDDYGRMDLNRLEEALDSRVKLVAVTHVPTNSGIINPVEDIGSMLNNSGCWYLIDACQSAGQVPLDTAVINCDFLSVTGRKYLRGPRGTGLLYASDRALRESVPLSIDLHSAEWTSADDYHIHEDARRYQQWEQNLSGKIGMAKAIDCYLQAGPERIYETLKVRAGELRDRLKTLDGVTVYDPGGEQGGIVTFDTPADPHRLKEHLSRYNINVSVSPQSSTRLDMERRGFGDLVRASVHYYNTPNEIERFTDAVEEQIRS